MTMIHIPAREGRGFRVRAGQEFRVIDPEGEQVADLFCFLADDPTEFLSAEHTRVTIGRLWPHLGEAFTTNLRRPILTWVADDSPGVHDMLCAACSPSRYELLGAEGHHASCEENLQLAMSEFGHEDIEIPQPVNIFEANPILENGDIGIETAPTKAGDSVTLRAEMDVDRRRHGLPAGHDPALRWHAHRDRHRAALGSLRRGPVAQAVERQVEDPLDLVRLGGGHGGDADDHAADVGELASGRTSPAAFARSSSASPVPFTASRQVRNTWSSGST